MDDAVGVDLQAFVDGGGPGGAEEPACGVARFGPTSEGEGQYAGQDDVGLGEVHAAGGEVDRVGAPARTFTVGAVVGAFG